MKSILTVILCWIWIVGCQDQAPTPKPRAFPKIIFPAHESVIYDVAGCPYTFEYPAYAEIREKTEPCWFDIYLPGFNARIHCSYLPVNSKAEYEDLLKDAFVIADKINERANYMEDQVIRNPQGVGGLSLKWSGPAASPIHFFLTDTTSHFFKAALYFDAKVQPDSLAPIVKFIEKDIAQLISSFTWK